jgi:hypothetical protein
VNPASKAIWAYRHFEDRVNSAVRKFGRHPLDVFDSFKSGNLDRWQLQGMSSEVRHALNGVVGAGGLSESDGAALMWWVRNSLFFSQQLQRDPRIMLWSYDAFVSDPERGLRELLNFVGGTWDLRMLAGVHDHSVRKEHPPTINATIRRMCHQLYDQLEDSRKRAAEPPLR